MNSDANLELENRTAFFTEFVDVEQCSESLIIKAKGFVCIFWLCHDIETDLL